MSKLPIALPRPAPRKKFCFSRERYSDIGWTSHFAELSASSVQKLPSSASSQAPYLIGLVALDTGIKLAAFASLDANEPIRRCLLCVVLRVNELNLAHATQEIVAAQGLAFLVAGAVFSFSLSAVLAIAAIKWGLSLRSVFVCLLIAAVVSSSFSLIYRVDSLPTPLAGATSLAANACLWLVIWVYSRSLWQLGAFFFSVAGVSNSLSAIYPPFRVVDYLWSTPLNEIAGMGVFNLADACWLLAFPVFVSALAVTLWRRLLHHVASPVIGSSSHRSTSE